MFHLTTEGGDPVLYDEITGPGRYCYDVNLEEWGAHFLINLQTFGGEMYYELRNHEVISNCGWQLSEGAVAFSGNHVEGGMGTYLQKEFSLEGADNCGYTVCLDMELMSGSLPLVQFLNGSGSVLFSFDANEGNCFSLTFNDEMPFSQIAYIRLFHHEETRYSFHSLSVEESCTTSVSDYVQVANVLGAQDYYPGGSVLPGRSYSPNSYRYGYQGSEKDDEITGVTGAHITTHFRELDTRLLRWWSTDPKANASQNPYMSMGGNPLWYNDPFGDTLEVAQNKESIEDVTSIVEKKDNLQYLNIVDGKASVDFGGMKQSDIEKLLNEDKGLWLLNTLSNAEEKYVYEAGDFAQGFTAKGNLIDDSYSASNNNYSFISNQSTTPRYIGIPNAPEGLKPVNSDGYVRISPGTFERNVPGTGKIKVPRASVVYHELMENYLRTRMKQPYERADGSGAHSMAKTIEGSTYTPHTTGPINFTHK